MKKALRSLNAVFQLNTKKGAVKKRPLSQVLNLNTFFHSPFLGFMSRIGAYFSGVLPDRSRGRHDVDACRLEITGLFV